jgi:hypothetical protein
MHGTFEIYGQLVLPLFYEKKWLFGWPEKTFKDMHVPSGFACKRHAYTFASI